jgi:hypothetical protein
MILRFPLIPFSMVILKKTNNKCWQIFKATENLCTVDGQISAIAMAISTEIQQKTKNRTPI